MKRLAHIIGGLIRPIGLIGLLCLFCHPLLAQHIATFNVPTTICAGDSQTVTFGYSPYHNIVIGAEESTLGHSERIFLPDGVPCGTMGCSYRSPVTFTAFLPEATITSAEDIKYLRINIEHSWLGDLYIGITCPNGQKASLVNFSNDGSSNCTSTIPYSHRGWSTGSNVQVGAHLGAARSGESGSDKCDSTAPGNEPGRGWNYCWSNNTSSGYTYTHTSASDDGIIYRSGHAHGGAIDSSNVAAKTNFYHPNQSFDSLIGCPLNGDWYIEVMDGWSGDNGYIFEWDLSLDAELIPPDTCEATGYMVTGDGVTVVNDSSFIINAPSDLTHDTTVYYHYHVFSSCGNDIDSVVALTFRPNYRKEVTVEAVENDLPVRYDGINLYTDTDTVFRHTNANDCDSLIHYTLTVFRNHTYTHRLSVCGNELPYEWNGYTFEESDTLTLNYQDIHGADSNLLLYLEIRDKDLQAEIKAIPLLVTPINPEFRLYDYSHNSDSCRWLIDGLEYSDKYLTYTFPVEADSLPVSLMAYGDNGCIDTTTIVILIDRSTMFTPNVFTPDANTNNTWQPAMQDIVGMDLWIYSRTGQLVCHLEGVDAQWDGTRNGEPCPQGAYVYTLIYKTVSQPEKQKKVNGTILLLR